MVHESVVKALSGIGVARSAEVDSASVVALRLVSGVAGSVMAVSTGACAATGSSKADGAASRTTAGD